jgi:hypothetical protein
VHLDPIHFRAMTIAMAIELAMTMGIAMDMAMAIMALAIAKGIVRRRMLGLDPGLDI